MTLNKILLLLFTLIIFSVNVSAMPQTTSDYNDSNWINSSKTITLSCSDTNTDLNCLAISYKIDNGDYNTLFNDSNLTTFIISFTVSNDGNHSIDFNSTSTDGNIEEI